MHSVILHFYDAFLYNINLSMSSCIYECTIVRVRHVYLQIYSLLHSYLNIFLFRSSIVEVLNFLIIEFMLFLKKLALIYSYFSRSPFEQLSIYLLRNDVSNYD